RSSPAPRAGNWRARRPVVPPQRRREHRRNAEDPNRFVPFFSALPPRLLRLCGAFDSGAENGKRGLQFALLSLMLLAARGLIDRTPETASHWEGLLGETGRRWTTATPGRRSCLTSLPLVSVRRDGTVSGGEWRARSDRQWRTDSHATCPNIIDGRR